MGIYSVMYYGGLVLSILFLIASVIIFFVMKIPHAFGIVTGRTQKKAIEEIRAGGTFRKGKRKVKQSDILVRDVDVSGMSSAPLKKDKSGAMEEARKRAEADAKAAVEKQAEEMAIQEAEAAKNVEEQDTEVLTYNDMKNKNRAVPSGEESTSVLGAEQDTDVLRISETASNTDENDNSVDIKDSDRTARGASVGMPPKANASVDEETPTDLLRNKPRGNIVPDADVTDVLIAPNIGFDSNSNDIYGTVSPETTSVLRADMVMGVDSVKPAGKRDFPEITVIYSETVVHTDESL
ncbi:MAG: hypothetical protein IKS48_05475 [Eubacterium sp.]|nr:hypothetical protein [Eubacterium sp.]